MELNITHTRWDTYIINMVFTDSTDAIINLTGSTIIFSLKTNLEDEESLITQHAILTDPTHWKAKITISATNMEKSTWVYWYDIQFTDSIWTVITPLKWQFNLTYDVTD